MCKNAIFFSLSLCKNIVEWDYAKKGIESTFRMEKL